MSNNSCLLKTRLPQGSLKKFRHIFSHSGKENFHISKYLAMMSNDMSFSMGNSALLT